MSTNLDLSELYKLKNFSSDVKHAEEHTYNNLTVIENIPHELEIKLDSVKTPLVYEISEACENLNVPEIDEESHDVMPR